MEAFVIREPELPKLPVVASLPHSGTWLPPGYAERLASDAMRALPMTDWHLPELFDFLPALGVSVIAARVSRFVIDLNRPPDGTALYPGRFETGLVPMQNFDGAPVFSRPPDAKEIDAARRDYYEPYHRARRELLRQCACNRGVIQLDLHSVTPAANRISDPLEQDIMLGDRDGTSCAGWLTDVACDAYTQQGFRATRNAPYKGGWITASCVDTPDVQALQIEMSWAVYMNLALPAVKAVNAPPFAETRKRLMAVFAQLVPNAVLRLSAI